MYLYTAQLIAPASPRSAFETVDPRPGPVVAIAGENFVRKLAQLIFIIASNAMFCGRILKKLQGIHQV